jgi:TonB-linked SusC/RagA family outer membrane protein
MKTVVVILLVGLTHVSAEVKSQIPRITLDLRDVTVERAVRELEKQLRQDFFFSKKEVDAERKVVVQLTDATLDEFVRQVFGTNFRHEIVDDIIVILPFSPLSQRALKKTVISGVVRDENKEPLPGVNIRVDGLTIGGVSDRDGKFQLSIPVPPPVTLIFSSIGYETKELLVRDSVLTVEVVLITDITELTDVVVTGYANVRKSSYTGSVKTVTQEQLLQVNPTNVLFALSVVEPSFRLVENIQDGSNPNVVPEYEMRGTSSLPTTTEEYRGSPNMPTFILDGFEVSAEKVFDLDPQRVESITLLKDAAATAIYGSRAGNGVVVITTKVATAGKMNVTYNLDMGGTFPDLRDYHLLNARQKLEAELAGGYYLPVNNYYVHTDLRPVSILNRQIAYNAKLKLIEKGNNMYWLNKALQNAVTNKHTLSIEGGEGAMRFILNATYDSAPGVMKKSGRTRKGLELTFQYTINGKLVLRDQVTYNDVLAKNSPYGSFSQYALINPYYVGYNDQGSYSYQLENFSSSDFGIVYNPLYNSELNMKNETRYNQWVNNFSMDWWINEAFRLKGNFSLSQRDDEGTLFKPASHTDYATWAVYAENGYRRGMYKATDGRSFGYEGSLVLSYNDHFGDHYLMGSAVVNLQEESSDRYTVTVEGFPDDKLDYIAYALQYSETDKVTAADTKSRMLGLLGSVNYAYANRFLFDFSFRSDASSKFGADRRWAPFWSAGVGWNLHKEKFMQELPFVNTLKIRGSYGLTGSQSFNPYQAHVMYRYWTDQRYRWSSGGASMKGMGNSNLEWQQVAKTNIGVDVEMFNHWIDLSFDYYTENTKGLLTDVMLPPSLGFPSYRENLGEIRNNGFELSLRAFLIKKKEGYLNVTLGAIRNNNKLMKLSSSLMAWNTAVDAESTNLPRVRYAEGLSTKTIWGVQSLGINPATGYEIFRTKDGKLTDVWNADDQVPIGVNEPEVEGNVSINAQYKGFQLTAYGRYRIGGQFYNQTLVSRVENVDIRYNADARVLDERWRYPGDITYFKGITQTTITEATSRFVNDYSYFQLASANLSYDFKKSWVRFIGARSLRLSASVNDIFRLSTIKAERGIDYPFARSARFSLRVVF